ncbi:eukaryotic translation initiation factor 4e-2-related [Anaeramoeba ignava]|uniref:Eukaryotic translation initiation factor 4e-2-related n=1 Tax=Anaeramoeba ignava TaxID=1746090 RepID=A0A9Q0LRM6_ANAIG|nr:eukaryotic translation initiation factor 4e-2-related [Anaeramoeba ignava]
MKNNLDSQTISFTEIEDSNLNTKKQPKHQLQRKWTLWVHVPKPQLGETKDEWDQNNLWLNTMLSLIGEQYDDHEFICGAAVSRRTTDRISLWTKDAEKKDNQIRIGGKFKEKLEIPENTKITFSSHKTLPNQEKPIKYNV